MQQIGQITKNNTYTNKKAEEQEMNVNAIPNNVEKYMAFMLGYNLAFINSFQFMASSLDKLVSNLPKEKLALLVGAMVSSQGYRYIICRGPLLVVTALTCNSGSRLVCRNVMVLRFKPWLQPL